MTHHAENLDAPRGQIDRSANDLAWDAFVAGHDGAHFLQTSSWGLLKSRFRWRNSRVVLYDGWGAIAAGASILYRRVAGLTLAYIPRGPLTNWDDQEMTRALFEEVGAECRRQGATVLKIEPGLADTFENRSRLAGYGFVSSIHSVQPRSTILLDISGDEEEILSRMKGKWRYNIRLARRKQITVREIGAEDLGAKDLAAFHQLMDVTAARDGFSVHSSDYYAAAHELLIPKDGVYLLAEYEDNPLAAIVVLSTGKTAWYVWGASNNRERNRMPNHALQWAGIQWARARGASVYDLWGIPDDIGRLAVGMARGEGSGVPSLNLPLKLDAMPAHDLWGVYRFKQGFGGNVVRSIGTWDWPVRPIGYRLYQIAFVARKRRQDVVQNVNGVRRGIKRPTGPAAAPQLPNGLRQVHRPDEWRSLLARFPTAHVLQSWEWGDVKGQTGWVAERLVVDHLDEKSCAGFQFLLRQPFPHLPLRVGYIPKGPLVDWADVAKVSYLLDSIEEYARARRCAFVKIDPNVREDSLQGRMLLAALERRGWRCSRQQIQFKNTAFTDLRVGEEALLVAMKSKWRYNIRLSQRRGIRVRCGDEKDLRAFYDLYAETGERDGFIVRPYEYYRTAWQSFLAAARQPSNPAGGALLLAEHEDDSAPAAGLFLLRYQDLAWYFYGASSERRRRDMPNHLLQWEAMRWSVEQGCTLYDWWGAPTYLNDKGDNMQGVWQFKQGFGAAFQPHIGAWDYPVFPLVYDLYAEVMPHAIALARRLSQQPVRQTDLSQKPNNLLKSKCEHPGT